MNPKTKTKTKTRPERSPRRESPGSIWRGAGRRSRTQALALAAGASLLGWALPAAAQSGVTLSGWLNLGLIKKTGGPYSMGTVSRSSLTFSGVEDLGGGLAATFRLGARMELDTGTTEVDGGGRPFWQQESTVGLKGGFGAIRLGRALTPIGAFDGNYDAWQVFDRIASPPWWFVIPDFVPDPRVGQSNSHDYGRVANGIFYDSPKFGGFHFHLSTAAGEGGGNDRARHYGASVNYDQGPLSLMLGAEQNSQRDRAYFVGAAYKVGPVNIMAAYSHVKLDEDSEIFGPGWTNWAAASEPKTKRQSFTLTSTIDVGVHRVLLGWGRDFQGSTNGFNYIGSTFTDAGTNYSGPSNFFGAGYIHNLSKRTSLFVDLGHVRWRYEDDNGRRHANGFAVGMNHGF